MPRTAIAVQSIIGNTGATLTFAAADSGNGMLFPNNGTTALQVKNGGGAPITVTIRSVACSHGRTGDISMVIAAGAEAEAPKLDTTLFNQTAADVGSVYVDFSGSTSVTVAAVSRN